VKAGVIDYSSRQSMNCLDALFENIKYLILGNFITLLVFCTENYSAARKNILIFVVKGELFSDYSSNISS